MSDPKSPLDSSPQLSTMQPDHTGPIKTPKQLITVIIFAFFVPIIVIILLVKFVANDSKDAAGTSSLEEAAVAARIQRVGSVEIKDASAPKVLKTAQEVYVQCGSCHAAGVAGAPVTGNVQAWEARIKTGLSALVASAVNGKGAMPAQGGGALSEAEITRAVVYMANASGAKFTEP